MLFYFMSVVGIMGPQVLHPEAPLAFAESLDFNMHYYMSVATPRQDEDYTDYREPPFYFALNAVETCYAVCGVQSEFIYTCTKNKEKPIHTKLVILDFSEDEIPPSEEFVVHVTALNILRDSGVVPRLLTSELADDRFLVFDYYGRRNLLHFSKLRHSVRRIARIGSRMLRVIRDIHSYGLVHGEVWNLKNWIYDSKFDSLILTNFKKAGLFVDPVTLEHVLEDEDDHGWDAFAPLADMDTDDVKIAKKSSRFRTSSKRRSIFAGGTTTKSVSRRDDLASIAEILINWLVGDTDLFADEYTARNANRESVRVAKRNRAKNLSTIYGDKIPKLFLDFYNYCLNLKFDVEYVDYDLWANELLSLSGATSSEHFIVAVSDRIGLKDIDFEHARMFESIQEKTENVATAAHAVLSLSEDTVTSEGITLTQLLISNSSSILKRISKILSRFVVLLKRVHSNGLVHNKISTDAFVWIGEGDDYGENYWRISQLDSSSLFVDGENHIEEKVVHEIQSGPLESLTVYQLDAYPRVYRPTRRDDAFALAEMAMNILFPSAPRGDGSREAIIAYKRNRHWNDKDHAGVVSRMYYRSMHYGYSEPPNYEFALGELMRKIV